MTDKNKEALDSIKDYLVACEVLVPEIERDIETIRAALTEQAEAVDVNDKLMIVLSSIEYEATRFLPPTITRQNIISSANRAMKMLNQSGHLRTPDAEKGRVMEAIVKKAQAVINRWETPDWKDAKHTSEFISELRQALEQYRKLGGA